MRGSFVVAVTLFISACAVPTPAPSSLPGCTTTTNGNTTVSALCPGLEGTVSDLYAVATTTDQTETGAFEDTTEIIAQIVPADDPVAKLAELLTQSFVSNAVLSFTGALQSFAAVLENVTPQCKCDVSWCNLQLRQAAQDASINSTNAAYQCKQATYECATLYPNGIDSAVPACAQYN